MKTLFCVIAMAALAFAAPFDVNVSGKWTGTFDATGPDGGSGESSPALLILKQEGTTVTGTAGPNEGEQYPINKGSVMGDKITIEIQPHEGAVIKMELVLADERLKGQMTMSKEGQTKTAKLDVGRAK